MRVLLKPCLLLMLLSVMLLPLVGCGQKGPLYLPQAEDEKKTQAESS